MLTERTEVDDKLAKDSRNTMNHFLNSLKLYVITDN